MDGQEEEEANNTPQCPKILVNEMKDNICIYSSSSSSCVKCIEGNICLSTCQSESMSMLISLLRLR